MKIAVSLILAFLMILTVFSGCGPADQSPETTAPTTEPAPVEHTLSVGYARVDITPDYGCPLGGNGDELNRINDNVKDPLNCDCIALTDESGNTILFISIDSRSVGDHMLMAANRISRKTGIPASNIMVATTHSHSAPDPYTVHPNIERYNEELQGWMVEAAEAAIADRKPAKMSIQTVFPEKINFIRHYELDDGTYFGPNFGTSKGKTILRHTGEADNSLHLLKFTREGGKDVVMMNWQGHPTGQGDRLSILSYTGSITAAVEAGLDCHCLFLLGASGNVNNGSLIKEEDLYSDYKERAQALAQYVIDAKDTFEELPLGKLQVLAAKIPCEKKASGNMDVPLTTYAIGDVAIAAAPYEMFNENGIALKAAPPFKMTMISTCTNGRVTNYIPAAETYEYNNKPDEVYEIRSSFFVQGTGEILRDAFVNLLQQMHEAK